MEVVALGGTDELQATVLLGSHCTLLLSDHHLYPELTLLPREVSHCAAHFAFDERTRIEVIGGAHYAGMPVLRAEP